MSYHFCSGVLYSMGSFFFGYVNLLCEYRLQPQILIGNFLVEQSASTQTTHTVSALDLSLIAQDVSLFYQTHPPSPFHITINSLALRLSTSKSRSCYSNQSFRYPERTYRERSQYRDRDRPKRSQSSAKLRCSNCATGSHSTG